MEHRNARFNEGNVTINCELNHPIHGWIPYTIDNDDKDMTIDNVALLAAIGDDIAAWTPPTKQEVKAAKEAWRERAYMPRAEFAEACAGVNIITWDEAAEWATGAALPAVAQAMIDAMPEAMQGPARFKLKTSAKIHRNAPEVLAIKAALKLKDEQVDGLFGAD